MATRYFALIAGILFSIIGLMGFVPNFLAAPAAAPQLGVTEGYGYLLGLFPVNVVHNLAHLALGVWGVAAFSRFDRARTFARASTIIYAILAVLGLFPSTHTLFGAMPLFGHDVWLHSGIALVSAYFGYVRDRIDVRGERPIYHT